MQMSAVVKLAILHMLFEVWHTSRQLILGNVLQTKLLKTWRVNDGGSNIVRTRRLVANPIERGAGGGVFARVERLRNLASQSPSIGHQGIHQGTFTRT